MLSCGVQCTIPFLLGFLFLPFFLFFVFVTIWYRLYSQYGVDRDAQSQDALCSRLSVHAAGGVVACLTLEHSAIPVLAHFSLFP